MIRAHTPGARTPAAVRAGFRAVYGGEPDALWAAPGRVNLIGEHTDHSDGFVLPVALPHTAKLAVRHRDDGVLRLHSAHWSRAATPSGGRAASRRPPRSACARRATCRTASWTPRRTPTPWPSLRQPRGGRGSLERPVRCGGAACRGRSPGGVSWRTTSGHRRPRAVRTHHERAPPDACLAVRPAGCPATAPRQRDGGRGCC
ncbi:galactokinase family protein [Streptomyces sp. JJ66]|nr:galactokinase family protein [Streptomyces sp. JJ66]